MRPSTETMRAAAIDRFGGVEELAPHTVGIPEIAPDEVLIALDTAGVGVWDPAEREGVFAQATGREPGFPHILGSDGAGTVAATGAEVTRLHEGQKVYAFRPPALGAGFYAEYVAVKADHVAPIPENLSMVEAGAMATDAVTALCGLSDILHLEEGETLLVFGASGGVGHLAVQLAQRMGARVVAVASGEDGVRMVRELGAEAAVNGHGDNDIIRMARQLAPHGVDTALITAAGEGLEDAMASVRNGGRVAYPKGVEPAPKGRGALVVTAYDGVPSPERLAKLNQLIESGPFTVHVERTFSLDEAAEAHRALGEHYLGKLALRISG